MIAYLLALAASFDAETVERMLDGWDVVEAERLAADLVRTRPGEASTEYVLGRLRFQQGRYRDAIQHLEKASRAESSDEWKMYLALARAAEQATSGFQSRSSPNGHFIIRFPAGKEEWLVPYLGRALEAQRSELEKDLGFVPQEVVRVELFPSAEDLARVSTLSVEDIETSGVVGLCKWNRLMIVSPRALLRGYPWLDAAAHEYVHYFVSRLTRDEVPLWLHEGVAKLKEVRWRDGADRQVLPAGMEELLGEALKRRRLIPFQRLHPSIAKLPSQREATLAFAQVATFVEHLDRYSARRGGLREILKRVHEGQEFEEVLGDVAGQTFADLEKSWKKALRSRKSVTGVAPLDLTFRRAETEEKDPDPSRVADQKAREFARLGALLEEQARARAAATEYEKALKVARVPVPLVSARLARLYLDLGEAEKALASARMSSKDYPDLAGPRISAGLALLQLERFREAVLELEEAIRINPFDPRVHCGLAEALGRLGDGRAEHEARACSALK